MGLFGKLFGDRDASQSDDLTGEGSVTYCSLCGDVNDNDELTDLCKRCYDEDSTGTSYCCGQIYEEGEVVCASCGEAL